jgi:RNA polymerase-binding transcription factor DksA
METTIDRQREMRSRLEGELRLVVGRLRALGAQVSPEVEGVTGGDSPYDTFENAEAHAARENLFASGERLGARAQQLVKAIERLEAGTYGTCVECDNPIGLARLRAIPEATTCVSCQERLDQGRPAGQVRYPAAAAERRLAEARIPAPVVTASSEDDDPREAPAGADREDAAGSRATPRARRTRRPSAQRGRRRAA